VLLYNDNPLELDRLRELASNIAEELCGAIRRHTPFTVSVALTDHIEDLYLLRNSMQQALSLMNYRFVYGGNRIFCPNTIAGAMQYDTEAEKMDAAFLQAVQRLKARLMQADLEGALEHLRESFTFIEKCPHPKQ